MTKCRGSRWAYLFSAFLIPATGNATELNPQVGDGCGPDLYYAADDNLSETPLNKPVLALAKIQRAALAGGKKQQRELAVSYESGYLISRCFLRAADWYGRAAKSGDEIAIKWIERNANLVKLARGPECVEDLCNVGDSMSAGAFYAAIDSANSFKVPITINGVTVEGIVDTGASTLSLGADIAAKLGLSVEGGRAGTAGIANGTTVAITAITVPNVKVAGITVRDVGASVGSPGSPTLIGMTVLNKIRMSAAGGVLTLTR